MQHTEGPWSWMHIGEKTNGYVIGVACDKDGKQLSGYIDDRDDMVDEVLYGHCIGEHEASTVNYADARLICAAPALFDVAKSLDDFQRHYETNTHNPMPGNDYYSGLLMEIVGKARAALANI